MRAICTYAGASTRLLPLTLDRHKAMLPVGGRLLVDWQLDCFAQSGVTDVVMVLGHGADGLEAHVRGNSSKLHIDFVRNTEYQRKNLDYSVFLASKNLEESCIYFEGDMLVHPEVISSLAGSPAEICLALDSLPQSRKVDTLVLGSGGRPSGLRFSEHGHLEISEHSDALGELLCLMKLSAAAVTRLNQLLQMSAMLGPMRLYSHLERLFAEFETAFIDVAGLPWIEIDTQADLNRAQPIPLKLNLNSPLLRN